MTTASVAISRRFERRYALTRIQQQVWASQRMHPDAPVANMGSLHRITGRIDPERFVDAFDRVVRACDALRTVVDERPGQPSSGAAAVLASPPQRTEVVDLDPADLDHWCARRIGRPLDATRCCYDSVLLRHSDGEWSWWLDLHHLVTDASSQALVHGLTSRAYLGERIDPSSFADAAEGASDASLADAPIAPADPPLRPYGVRGKVTTSTTCRSLILEQLEAADLAKVAAARYPSISGDLSLAALFAAALACTMQRLDGRSEYSIGLPVHHRADRRRRQLVGPLMELHPVRVAIEPDDTFVALVERTLAEIVVMLQRSRRETAAPGTDFEMVVNIFRTGYDTFGMFPEVARWVRSPHVDPAHSIRLHAFDHGDQLAVELEVNDALVDQGRDGAPARFDRHLAEVVTRMLADPHTRVDAFPIATAEDRETMARLNPSGAPFAGPPVHDLIRSALEARPDWVVAEDRTGHWSAQRFDRAVERSRAWLHASGVERGDRVGIRMPRSVDVLVAIHAVLRSGAAFVMLDPNDPPARHESIATDAGLRMIIDDLCGVPDTGDGRLDPVDVDPDDIAYVLYTSGSTGVPKGVPIPHRGLSDYLHFAAEAYVSGAEAPVVALHSALIFDLTITSMFLSFVSGGKVVVFEGEPFEALARIARNDDITFLKATPSQLEIMTRMVETPRPIRTVVVGGEAFRRPIALAVTDACRSGVRIFNEYGPTEAVVGCMIHEWDPAVDVGADVPIGRAAPGCEIAVSDRFGHPTAVGAWGELWVRRVGMATGYLDRPELTAQRFVSLADVPGRLGGDERGPWYRTGDRVRVDRTGAVVYGGRFDDQMKVNGVRLEPAEVEAALVEHPQVASAIVRLWTPDARVVRARCVRCGLGDDVPGVTIDDDGTCSTCHAYDAIAPQAQAWFRTSADLDEHLARARASSTGGYDCLHLLSGGKDSSYALYQLVERGWRVHALTLDNGFISDGAKANIASSVDALGITHEFATTDAMDAIFRDSLDRHSNVCQGCYKTIYTLAVARAEELGIPVIVTGLSRGQFFETRLIPAQFDAARFDPDAIDATVLEARKVYHGVPDAVTELLPEQRVFDDGSILDRIEFLDFYRYVDVDMTELYRYLEQNAPWVRPADTGRSTNCLINVAGIQVHHAERGFHNYAEAYSWDVRLGHKSRAEALAELDDLVPGGVDAPEIRRLLDAVGYRPTSVAILTAWYRTVDGRDLDPDELRTHLRGRVASNAIPSAFVRLDEMPLAASAKADVSALPPPSRVHRHGTATVEATTATERALCDVWATVLHLEQVGVTDDFFDLGGDSLAALEVVALVGDTLGVPLDDAAVFRTRTVRLLAQLIVGADDSLGAPTNVDSTIPALDSSPLSAGEEAMLFEHRRDPLDTRYNITRWYRLPAAIDVTRLEQAIRDVVGAHQPLHTSYAAARSDLGDRAVAVTRVEAPTADDFAAYSRERRREPFDLDAGPLVRVDVGASTDPHTGSPCTSVLIGMHHITIDAGTFDVFWDQVAERYAGVAVAAFPVTYAAHGEWQRREVHQRHAEHWSEVLRGLDRRGEPGRLALPPPEPAEADGYLSRPLGLTTKELRSGPGRTPFVVALTAAATVLARHSDAPAVELGITASVKDHPAAAGLVGYFLNTVPVRIEVDPKATFTRLVERVDDVVTDAVDHRAYPFASIVRDAREAGVRPPDVSSMLAYERLAPAHFDGREVSHEILASGTAVADVTLFVQERGDDVSVGIEYSGRVLSEASAERLLDAFARILHEALRVPDVPVTALGAPDLIGRDLTGPALPDHAPTVLHDVVERWATQPDAIAVVDTAGGELTYAALGARALALAATLDVAGGLVGVCMERSGDIVVAMLAAQFAGAAYVPLDPASPADRLLTIGRSIELSTILVDEENRDRFDEATVLATEAPGEDVDGLDALARATDVLRGIDGDDLAYVIFTSGSTGRPRGVAVSHANLAASTAARRVTYDEVPGRFLLTSSIGFDSSVVGLFWPLVSGGTIVVPTERDVRDVDRLVEVIEHRSVSHVLMVPSLYRAVLERSDEQRLDRLRVAVVAGEACPPDVVALHHRTAPGALLFNEYGPTEASVWATVHPMARDGDRAVPIGRPIAGVTARVADAAGTARPTRVAGELLLAGPTVTGGYLDDPAATRERFVELDDRRWYRTGDVVRADDDGVLTFLGRIDDQLNVGGVRIEPGEIERVLIAAPGVTEAVVVPSPTHRHRLVAHVEADAFDEAALRRRLATVLPSTHVPRRIVSHPQLPRTSHGKLDRAAAARLPLPVAAATTDGGAPSGIVTVIVEVWRRILGRDDIGATTDYFEAGGDSLAAVEIVSAVEDVVGSPVTVGVLLDGRTPSGMAELISGTESLEGDRAPAGSELRRITMQAGRPDGPLVLCTAAWDDVFGYRDLSAALPAEFRVVALTASGDGAHEVISTVDGLGSAFVRLLAEEAADDLRRRIVVLGWSTGGVVAYDLGSRLRELGHAVESIVMIDTFFPGAEQHLWSNRWWKYKSLLTPSAFLAEVSTTIRRRSRKYAGAMGRRLLAFAGTPVPEAPERTSVGGVPLEAFGYRPAPNGIPVVMYAASTTNPDRTVNGWRRVADVEVVQVEGRHRGYRSIMGADRVGPIAADLAVRCRAFDSADSA